ncbi:hypothetical protein RRG08_002099 [Elysia crispata]|uniref:Uncharacterized protein n=1 Tax=Elysia crispata TaxID=231223 RepID=A0AAE0ZLE6_9GAST|nr:hypothetical protein RRG08_002099 [Elysia crispata]
MWGRGENSRLLVPQQQAVSVWDRRMVVSITSQLWTPDTVQVAMWRHVHPKICHCQNYPSWSHTVVKEKVWALTFQCSDRDSEEDLNIPICSMTSDNEQNNVGLPIIRHVTSRILGCRLLLGNTGFQNVRIVMSLPFGHDPSYSYKVWCWFSCNLPRPNLMLDRSDILRSHSIELYCNGHVAYAARNISLQQPYWLSSTLPAEAEDTPST